MDLFNHGYYWEAHEVWESLWIAASRQGVTADFLKGLIKLAAAGVKTKEGNPTGAARHTKRAVELLSSVLPTATHYCGLDLTQVIEECHSEVRRGIWLELSKV